MPNIREAVEFVEITADPLKNRERLQQNYEEWHGVLDLQGYIEREEGMHTLLERCGLGHRMFVLKTKEGHIVSSCDVMARRAYFRRPEDYTGNLAIDYVLASVFTPSDRSGLGYATELVKDVCKLLTDSSQGTLMISLWSDVGHFYKRCGFDPLPEKPGSFMFQQLPPGQSWPVVTTLDIQRVAGFVDAHQKALISAVDEIALLQDATKIAVLPDRGLFAHYYLRTEHDAKALGISLPTIYGACTPSGHGWAAWAYLFGQKKAKIFAICGSADEIATLIIAAQVAASSQGLPLEMYEDSLLNVGVEEVVAALEALNVKFDHYEREESLPMYFCSNDAKWVLPGAYAWF